MTIFLKRKKSFLKQGNTLDDYYISAVRDGYSLEGFKIDGDSTLYKLDDDDLGNGEKCIYDYKPTKNVTFLAQWEEGYTITYDAGEGYFSEDDSIEIYTYKKGSSINRMPGAIQRRDMNLQDGRAVQVEKHILKLKFSCMFRRVMRHLWQYGKVG